MIGIGILGLGVHGTRYARHLLAGDVPGARLVAVQRRNRTEGEAFARRERGVRFHAEPEALLADPDVGLVIVTTPPDSHRTLAEAAGRRGIACLVEKPLARSRAEAEPLRGRPARGPGLLACAFPLRWNPVLRALRERLPEAGELLSLTLSLRQERHPPGSWRHDPAVAGGGVLLDYGSHLVDLARWLTRLEILEARAALRRAPAEAAEDAFAASLALGPPGGPARVIASCEGVSGTPLRTGRVEVVGTRGALVADFRGGSLSRPGDAAPIAVPPGPAPLAGILAAAVAAAGGEALPDLPTVGDGLAALAAVDSCYDSSREAPCSA
ncbi:MAG: Gfo/Idh/MocA family oxidoreductase [Planctomycetales bacterium]|nr:Gfo/Idh/MocA family oxidoreductase [Planctomycetales bacterium]